LRELESEVFARGGDSSVWCVLGSIHDFSRFRPNSSNCVKCSSLVASGRWLAIAVAAMSRSASGSGVPFFLRIEEDLTTYFKGNLLYVLKRSLEDKYFLYAY